METTIIDYYSHFITQHIHFRLNRILKKIHQQLFWQIGSPYGQSQLIPIPNNIDCYHFLENLLLQTKHIYVSAEVVHCSGYFEMHFQDVKYGTNVMIPSGNDPNCKV